MKKKNIKDVRDVIKKMESANEDKDTVIVHLNIV